MVLTVLCLLLWLGIGLPSGVQGEFVELTDVTIECDPSGVEIVVNSTALEEAIPSLDGSSLKVGQGPWLPQCFPDVETTSGRDMKTFKFSYGDCHPTITDLTDTQLRLEYEIQGEKKSPEDGAVGGTKVSCFVPKDGLIRAKISENTNIYEYVGTPDGQVEFGITIYKDSFMSSPVESEEEIPLGFPLWIEIRMNSTGTEEMYVRDCWATPSPSKSTDQPEHIFIKNGIIGEDDETFSPVDDVITATSYGFSFDSFMFRGSGNRVYIKCNVHVCEADDVKNNRHACSIPKYPEFEITGRDSEELGSGSGSGFGLNLERELTENDETNEETLDEEDGNEEEKVEKTFPSFFVMHSFKVKHLERKRRSAGSYRIYPRHTVFNNLRSGITLGIIIASTAMISACAILLPLHLSGEKVRCLHVKPMKRTI